MRRKTDILPENPPLFTGGLHLEFALYHHRAGPPRRRIAGGGLGDPAALVRALRGALGAIFLFSLLFSGEQRSASPPALTLRPARPARVAPPVASQHHARPRAGRPLAPPLTPCSPSADWLILCKLRRRGPPAAPPPPPRRPPRAAAMAAPGPHPLSTPLPPLSPPLSSIFTSSNPLPHPPAPLAHPLPPPSPPTVHVVVLGLLCGCCSLYGLYITWLCHSFNVRVRWGARADVSRTKAPGSGGAAHGGAPRDVPRACRPSPAPSGWPYSQLRCSTTRGSNDPASGSVAIAFERWPVGAHRAPRGLRHTTHRVGPRGRF